MGINLSAIEFIFRIVSQSRIANNSTREGKSKVTAADKKNHERKDENPN
jgi:hypothetical protein